LVLNDQCIELRKKKKTNSKFRNCCKSSHPMRCYSKIAQHQRSSYSLEILRVPENTMPLLEGQQYVWQRSNILPKFSS
jgi:hypothetical protein